MSNISTTMEYNLSTATIRKMGNLQTLDQYLEVSNVSSVTRFTALQDCVFNATGYLPAGASGNEAATIYHNTASGTQFLLAYGNTNIWNSHNSAVSISGVAMKKGEYLFFANNRSYGDFTPPGQTAYTSGGGGTTGACMFSVTVTPQTNSAIVLESQDEIFTSWTAYTPTFENWGTAGSVSFFWRRVGDTMEIKGSFTAGSPGTGVATISLPSGYSMDPAKLDSNLRNQVGECARIASGIWCYWFGNHFVVHADPAETSKVFFDQQAGGVTFQKQTGNNLSGTGDGMAFKVWGIPIQGWNSNFNPLLSMPLVDIGGNTEYYRINKWTGNSGYSLYSDETPAVNTIDKLGTIYNNNTATSTSDRGFFFEAKQRCKVTFSYYAQSTSTPDMGIGGGASNLDFNGNNILAAHFHGYRLAVLSGQDATATEALCSVVVLNPGERVGIAWQTSTAPVDTSSYSGAASVMVEKDYSNTNMAHIIKPAVAYIKDIKAYDTDGGTSTSGAFRTRDLNTIEGESWFVTLADPDFTIEPGTYKINVTSPFYSSVGTYGSIRLYDVTNSSVIKYSSTSYTTNSANDVTLGALVTISSSTAFRIQYRTDDTVSANGLGLSQYTDSTAVSVFTQVRVEKLK